MPPEQGFWVWLREQLTKKGYFCKRIETTTGLGYPDVFVARNGKCAFIELKAMRGTVALRPEQGAWHREAASHGLRVFILNRDPGTKICSFWEGPVELRAPTPQDGCERERHKGLKIVPTPKLTADMSLFADKLPILFGF